MAEQVFIYNNRMLTERTPGRFDSIQTLTHSDPTFSWARPASLTSLHSHLSNPWSPHILILIFLSSLCIVVSFSFSSIHCEVFVSWPLWIPVHHCRSDLVHGRLSIDAGAYLSLQQETGTGLLARWRKKNRNLSGLGGVRLLAWASPSRLKYGWCFYEQITTCWSSAVVSPAIGKS